MRKVILISIIICLVLGLLYQTNRLSSFELNDKNLKDSLKIARQELRNCNADFHFDQIVLRPICKNRIVKLGDSLEFKVGIVAQRIVYPENKQIESFIILGKARDSEYRLFGPYDTIPTKDWLGKLKIQATKLGLDTIYGEFHMPRKDKFQSYPFTLTYYTVKDDIGNAIVTLDTIKYGW